MKSLCITARCEKPSVDALHLQSGFEDEVEDLGWEWVITLKANQPELLTEAQRLTHGQAETISSTPHEELQLWRAGSSLAGPTERWGRAT